MRVCSVSLGHDRQEMLQKDRSEREGDGRRVPESSLFPDLRDFHQLRHQAEDALGLEEQDKATLRPVDGKLIVVAQDQPGEAHAQFA